MLRDFFLGFVRIHILHHAAHGPVYGLSLMQELGRHGHKLSAGTLYPLLRSLELGGYLSSKERNVGGKVRKYYSITPQGTRALEEAKPKIMELVDEVLKGSGPHKLLNEPDSGKRAVTSPARHAAHAHDNIFVSKTGAGVHGTSETVNSTETKRASGKSRDLRRRAAG